MRSTKLTTAINLIALACLVSCSNMETVPRVSVKPNNSGIEIGKIEKKASGMLSHPDEPSRTVIEVKRVRALHNKEPRYFIAASGVVEVISIERYSDYGKVADLDRWRSLLHSPNPLGNKSQEMLNETNLSEIPWVNAARCFHGKLRKRSFPWGDAVLFLTSYVQGTTGGPVNNDMLVLVAQGFTKDGKYAVNANFEIYHPKLPNSSWDNRQQGKAIFSIDTECEEAERWLDTQSDDAFTPTFGQYEQFLSNLLISAK